MSSEERKPHHLRPPQPPTSIAPAVVPTTTVEHEHVQKAGRTLPVTMTSASSTTATAPTTLALSVRCCDDCQSALIRAFHHCLAKPSVTLPSTRQLLDDAMERGATTVPMFKPVADPAAEQRDRLFISDTERVRKEQAIEGEINLQKLDRVGVPLVAPSSHSHKPPKMVVDQPRGNRQQRQVLNVVASTAVGDSSRDDARADSDNTDSEDEVTLHARFRAGDNGGQFRLKQHALAQQREILRLRADLIDARETEASEHQLVKKLRAALQRSLDYCMRAKEWQEQESTAMHSVIGDLKTEVGVLMAYVLNSEHDKQEIEARVQAANEETAQSLQQNHDLVRTVADLRAKLHLAHKDFIGVNQRLEKATQDAANGNELTLKKNETLKATLSRLSKEFAMSNQTRLGLDAKIKDLKFELEHIVYQFNKLGEEKLVADRDNENLRTVLKKWETDFRKLSEEFQRTSEEKFKLSIEHQHLQQTSAATQSELEQRLAKLTGDHEALLSAKTAQDATVAKMSQTLQENATHIKALSEFKATADEKRAKADALFRKEIQARDAVIASTTEELTVERQRSARFLDAKEQLLLEVNDLKNVLDREIQNGVAKMEELDIQKRRMLENTGLWEAKIKQLEMAKANLIAEKGLMAESLASLQDQHRAKVDEMATFQKVTDLNITELRDEIAALERKLDAEQVAHQDLASRHESLQSEHTATLEDKTMLTQSVTDLYHKAAKFQFEVNTLKEQLARVTEEKCATQSSLDQTRAEKAKLEGEMARLHTHILDLEAAAAAIQREHNQLFESRDKTIAGLQVDVRDLKTEIQSQAIARRHLMRRLRELIDLYKSEHEKLRAEIVLRQQLETRLNDLRVSHENELRARIAFEGIQHRMSWKQAERDLLAFRQLKERERKFLWLDRELHEEFERLNGFYREVTDAYANSTIVG